MAMKSSSVCALEPEKITKTKWAQKYGTPCRNILMDSVNSFKIMMTKKLSRLFEHKYWNGWQSLMSALCFIGTRVHHSVVTGYNDIMKDHNFWAYRDCLPWNFSYCYNNYFSYFIQTDFIIYISVSFSFLFDNVSKLNQCINIFDVKINIAIV